MYECSCRGQLTLLTSSHIPAGAVNNELIKFATYVNVKALPQVHYVK